MRVSVAAVLTCIALIAAQAAPASEPPRAPAAQALEAYLDLDRARLSELADASPVAEALLGVFDREQDAAITLARMAETLDAPELQSALERIALQELGRQGRWADAVRLDARLDGQGADPFAQSYAGFAAPGFETDADVVEVPFDGLKVPARLNGAPIEIAMDTGAPGIGVDAAYVRELGLQVDRSVSRASVVPAVDLRFEVFPVRIDTLEIGEARFTNVPANFGDLTEEQAERASRLPQFDLIMGLDLLGRHFDVVEFDYDANVMRLIREAPEAGLPANFIHGGGLKPVINARTGQGDMKLYLDTGANRHSFPITAQTCIGARRYEQSWGEFTEYLAEISVAGSPAYPLWSSISGFGSDEAWGVQGVFGHPRTGVIQINLRDGRVDYSGYALERAEYSFEPVEVWRAEDRPCGLE